MTAAGGNLSSEIRAESRRVLVVSHRFPPHGGGGVHRVAGFVKHLRRFGWTPHVLTGPFDETRPLHDPSLLETLPEGMSVTRTSQLDTRRLFRWLGRVRLARVVQTLTPTLPMMEAGWIPYGYREGLRMLRDQPFDLIYSSAYPVGSHIVAYLLTRRTGLPWVADYRDEWSQRPYLNWPTPLHQGLAVRIDRRLMETAYRIITTSPLHTEKFARIFPTEDRKKYITITNAFDEDDFRRDRYDRGSAPSLRSDRLVIAHVGTLTRWRNADGLVTAVRRLVEAGRLPIDKFQLVFAGHTAGLDDEWLQKSGILHRRGYLPHKEAVDLMQTSDILLLINNERANILGKTFEYLAARRPILGLLTSGATAQVVKEARAGVVVDPDDVEGIANVLADWFVRWTNGELECASEESVIRRYSRSETTRRLAGLFDSLVLATPESQEL